MSTKTNVLLTLLMLGVLVVLAGLFARSVLGIGIGIALLLCTAVVSEGLE
jgi:hypothetical protein